MAQFKISAGTAKGKTWKAEGINPFTGRNITIQGGQKGTPVGKTILTVKHLLMQGMRQLA